ncbi:DUF6069 family protein [Actinomadura scrupuli]|uniref:DUF6069 family protein n=1 Tax=Actinomadura scrupuli TaxID=559629 RepID=UPI003D997B20
MITDDRTSAPAPSGGTRRRRRAIAAGGAVAAAGLLWLVARALDVDLRVAQGDGQESQVVGLPMVAGCTLVVALLGWGVLALLEHRTRRARTWWTGLAAAVLLLSFVPVVTVSATTGTKVALSLMHLAVAAVLIPSLRGGGRPAA